MLLNESYKKVCEEVLNDSSIKKDINSAILALHESTTKIYQAVENNQKEKIDDRIAGALISIFYIMRELKIDNPEECLIKKINELKK